MYSFLSQLGSLLVQRIAQRKLLNSQSRNRSGRPAKSTYFRVESLEDRTVPTTLTVGVGQEYATIPAAIAAVQNSAKTTIDVYPGTYGAFSVPSNLPNLTITALPTSSNPHGVLIQPTSVTPLTLSGVSVGGAAIDIYASGVKLGGLFTVDGSKDTDGNLWAGIRAIEGALNCTISGNTVENIINGPAATNVGIQIGTSLVSGSIATGSGTISGNTILNYQGAGVLVDGNGSAATISGNTITGRGTANAGVNEYGIEVNGYDNKHNPGSTQFNISGNTITGNTESGGSGAPHNPNPTSAGVFIYFDNVASQSHITGDTLTGNDDGVLVQSSNTSNDLMVDGNTVSGNYGYAGIFLLSSNGITVEQNTVSGNTTYNGIALNFSCNDTIYENTTSSNGTSTSQSDGIFDLGGSNNLISSNTSSSNSGNGINLTNTSNDTVNSNTASSNLLSGIYDQNGSNDQIGTGGGNTFSTNGLYGADLNGVTNIQVNGTSKSNNTFYNNTSYGVYVQNNSKGVQIEYDTFSSPSSLWIGFDSSGSAQISKESNNTFNTK